MDSSAKTVLISIHPQYVDLISSGKKKIEFRKRNFACPVKRFVVYSTAPVSKIVGFFDVEDIECTTPQKLWENYASVGGIEQKDYFEYYANTSNAVGIRIKKYTPFQNAFNISVLNTTPPQSYKYLTDRDFILVNNLGNGRENV
ncbi:MAG: ASCH domain-containing protein [Treponema sp.]|nr:ASCH domain-containing protein [Treponema sp.]